MISKQTLQNDLELLEKKILDMKFYGPGESPEILTDLFRKSALKFCIEQNEDTIKQRLQEIKEMILNSEPSSMDQILVLLRYKVHYYTMRSILES